MSDYRAIEVAFLASGKSGLMTVLKNDNCWDRSNVEFADGRIVAYDKERQTPGMQHIDYGLGAMRHSAFAGYPDGEPFDLATVYQRLLASDDLAGFEVQQRFFEVGSIAGLEETRVHLTRTRKG